MDPITNISQSCKNDTPNTNTNETISPNKYDDYNGVNISSLDDRVPSCAHPNCLRPGTKTDQVLRWVKCCRKKCKKWHHFECAGLKYDQDYENTFYDCKTCGDPQPTLNNIMSYRDNQSNGREIRKAALKASNNTLKLIRQDLL